MAKDEPISILHDLIAACRDAEEGFGKAAKGAHSEDLRSLLTGYSRQHSAYADELQQEVKRLGREPETTGNVGGILHRGWADLEARIRPKDDAEFLENCRHGQKATVQHYASALARLTDPQLCAVVERQDSGARHILDELLAKEAVFRAG